jgi:hypothetical protein
LESGRLVRKPSGGERAWLLKEESEPRNKHKATDISAASIGPVNPDLFKSRFFGEVSVE